MAYSDPLTGLGNRALLRGRGGQGPADGPRRRPAVPAAARPGRVQGGQRLARARGRRPAAVAMAQRLVATSGRTTLVARLGGDEFAVLVERTGGRPRRLAERLLEALAAGELRRTARCQRRASARRARSGLHAARPAAGRRRRDVRGQGRRRGRVRSSSPRQPRPRARPSWRRLRLALERGEFPRPTTSRWSRWTTGRASASEALVRWEHPDAGCSGPTEFIAAGRGDRAHRATSAAGCSRGLPAGAALAAARPGRAATMAVNLSPRQLVGHDLSAPSPRARPRAGLPRGLHPRDDRERPDGRRRGDGAAAGRRASSACRWRSTTSAPATRRSPTCARFPVDMLKIDRSFVSGMGNDARGPRWSRRDRRPRRHARPRRRSPRGSSPERSATLLRALGCTRPRATCSRRPLPADDARPSLLAAGRPHGRRGPTADRGRRADRGGGA